MYVIYLHTDACVRLSPASEERAIDAWDDELFLQ